MKKFLAWIWILWIALPLLFSCSPLTGAENTPDGSVQEVEKTVPDVVVEEVNWREQQRVIPPDLAQAIKTSGIPIYEGLLPPFLTGSYQIEGTLTISTRARDPGASVKVNALFSNQNLFRNVTGSEGYLGISGKGWIVGQNGQFTVYILVPADKTGCSRAWVISGTQHEKDLKTTVLFFFSSKCGPSFQEVHTWSWRWVGPITAPPPDYADGEDDPPQDDSPSSPPDPPGWP